MDDLGKTIIFELTEDRLKMPFEINFWDDEKKVTLRLLPNEHMKLADLFAAFFEKNGIQYERIEEKSNG